MNRHLSALGVAAGFLAAFSGASPAKSPLEGQQRGSNSERLCDTPMAWTYKAPAANVPKKYLPLYGLWTGDVEFNGGNATMCVAVAVQEIHADGKTDSIFTWNLGNTESPNTVSRGQANWWAQTMVVSPEKGEQLVFAAIAPYKGLWYRYVLDLPTKERPDVIVGRLYASQHGSKDDVSSAAWGGTTEAWSVTLRRNRNVPFALE